MKKLLVLTAVISLLISCSKEKLEGDILIRVQNESSQNAESIVLISSTDHRNELNLERNYGNLGAGQGSDYKPHVFLMSDGLGYSFKLSGSGEINSRPVCPVGASRLSPGKYTLHIIEYQDGIQVSLIPD